MEQAIQYKALVISVLHVVQQCLRRQRHLREGEEFRAEVLQGGAEVIDGVIHDEEPVVDVAGRDQTNRFILGIMFRNVQLELLRHATRADFSQDP